MTARVPLPRFSASIPPRARKRALTGGRPRAAPPKACRSTSRSASSAMPASAPRRRSATTPHRTRTALRAVGAELRGDATGPVAHLTRLPGFVVEQACPSLRWRWGAGIASRPTPSCSSSKTGSRPRADPRAARSRSTRRRGAVPLAVPTTGRAVQRRPARQPRAVRRRPSSTANAIAFAEVAIALWVTGHPRRGRHDLGSRRGCPCR